MFKINDVIVYKNRLVCTIKDIGVPDFITTGQIYYKLQRVNQRESLLYVKYENCRAIRYPLPRQDAKQYMESFSDMESIYDKSDRYREKDLTEALDSSDYIKQLRYYKGIALEKTRRSRSGKSLPVSDDKNMKKLENLLYPEFSVSLGIPEEEVKQKLADACN